jgi:hypothetical protein
MSTLCESLRAKAVIVLLGIPLLSSSHAQELMGHSKFGTVLPQAVATRHLDSGCHVSHSARGHLY